MMQIAPIQGEAATVPQPAGCLNCSMSAFCLPAGLNPEDTDRLDRVVRRRRKVARGSLLVRSDEEFVSLYAVRSGHFKTSRVHWDGEEQITGFLMAGEMLGMNAIGSGRQQYDIAALENAEVCEIPYMQLEPLFMRMPVLVKRFQRMMSAEMTREQGVMLLLATMPAAQRLASFLMNLSSRYAARGGDAHCFVLRMGREQIGNYLGLTIESISRMLTKFKKQGLIQLAGREVTIVDAERLRAVAVGAETVV